MSEGSGKSRDWQGCEQCAYCFTQFVGSLFFCAGAGIAVVSGLMIFTDLDLGFALLGPLEPLSYTTFAIGIAIAAAALLGIIMSCCARCAANPDGVCDGTEKCCTAFLSILYLVLLLILLVASLALASALTYYAVEYGDSDSNSCPGVFNATQKPEDQDCPVDALVWDVIFDVDTEESAASWITVQDTSVTCGYFCGTSDQCDPSYPQATGTYCTESVADATLPSWTVYPDTNFDSLQQNNEPTTQGFRPTLFSLLDTYMIALLAILWSVFVLAILLIVAACAMCIRKSKTKKESTYKPSES